jgi:predicted transcriptional regulator
MWTLLPSFRNEPAMPEWTVAVPDELDARVRSHVERLGDNLSEFVSRAVREQLEYEVNEARQSQMTEKIKRGMAEIDAGQGVDARQAMREIADEFGIDLKR